ncbi:hypothetical protein [Rhodococcus ruber]|uniref:hypothetical protein n=1 Tax=Rhodococcus ruber TaxID=1830 RepID=UPI00112264D6|nr:hypothetical protein [Rhodococcus ruber]QDC15886.1 hypothetical protein E2561_18675 [Rhodococcus ruber]
MNHVRVVRAVAFVTAGYLVVLALWLGLFVGDSPEGTVPYQIMFLLAAYGSALGIAMMLAGRPPRADRRLARRGLEGWATITSARHLGHTVDNGELTELDLDLTVPGSEPYHGRVLYEVAREDLDRFEPGRVVGIRVDPRDRDRIVLCP